MGCRPRLPHAASVQTSRQHSQPTGLLQRQTRETSTPSPLPPAYSQSNVYLQRSPQQPSVAPVSPAETDALKLKKAWEIAIAPSKQIPMNAIMMYMSGNSLQIFSIMMVFMLFKGPIQGLLGTNAAFAKFDSEGTRGKLIGVKIVYVLMQLGLLGLGVWKVNAMGLLPCVYPFSVGRGCADSTGRRDRIGWRGSQNGCHWNGLLLLLGEY